MSPYIVPGLTEEEDSFGFKINRMVYLICNYCGFDVDTVRGELQTRAVCRPRHLCFYFMQKYPKLTLKRIGEYFGGRDHTTVLNGIKGINDFLDINDDITVTSINEIENLLAVFQLNSNEDFIQSAVKAKAK